MHTMKNWLEVGERRRLLYLLPIAFGIAVYVLGSLAAYAQSAFDSAKGGAIQVVNFDSFVASEFEVRSDQLAIFGVCVIRHYTHVRSVQVLIG